MCSLKKAEEADTGMVYERAKLKAGVRHHPTVIEKNRWKLTFSRVHAAPTAGLLDLKWQSQDNKATAKILSSSWERAQDMQQQARTATAQNYWSSQTCHPNVSLTLPWAPPERQGSAGHCSEVISLVVPCVFYQGDQTLPQRYMTRSHSQVELHLTISTLLINYRWGINYMFSKERAVTRHRC